MSANLSAIFYLVSGVLFILALRGLSSPETSRQGNFFGILGMVIAITVTFLSVGSFSSGLVYVLIFLLVGGLIGAFIAYKIIIMKIKSSLKSLKKRDLNSKLVRRRGRVYIINKTNPKFKARQK